MFSSTSWRRLIAVIISLCAGLMIFQVQVARAESTTIGSSDPDDSGLRVKYTAANEVSVWLEPNSNAKCIVDWGDDSQVEPESPCPTKVSPYAHVYDPNLAFAYLRLDQIGTPTESLFYVVHFTDPADEAPEMASVAVPIAATFSSTNDAGTGATDSQIKFGAYFKVMSSATSALLSFEIAQDQTVTRTILYNVGPLNQGNVYSILSGSQLPAGDYVARWYSNGRQVEELPIRVFANGLLDSLRQPFGVRTLLASADGQEFQTKSALVNVRTHETYKLNTGESSIQLPWGHYLPSWPHAGAKGVCFVLEAQSQSCIESSGPFYESQAIKAWWVGSPILKPQGKATSIGPVLVQDFLTWDGFGSVKIRAGVQQNFNSMLPKWVITHTAVMTEAVTFPGDINTAIFAPMLPQGDSYRVFYTQDSSMTTVISTTFWVDGNGAPQVGQRPVQQLLDVGYNLTNTVVSGQTALAYSKNYSDKYLTIRIIEGSGCLSSSTGNPWSVASQDALIMLLEVSCKPGQENQMLMLGVFDDKTQVDSIRYDLTLVGLKQPKLYLPLVVR